ncbi:hypothetical protein JTB14_017844 [Gonioctena quinquepunctata]|nr:hypothetical protein JTB14_017844 [Gonioctena quinquepunctata]
MDLSSSDEDKEDVVYLANMQIERRFWVHPLWLKKGKTGGTFDVLRELNTYPEGFQNFFSMSHACFHKILSPVNVYIVAHFERHERLQTDVAVEEERPPTPRRCSVFWTICLHMRDAEGT